MILIFLLILWTDIISKILFLIMPCSRGDLERTIPLKRGFPERKDIVINITILLLLLIKTIIIIIIIIIIVIIIIIIITYNISL